MMIDFMYTFENILGKMTTYYSFINFNIYIVKDKSSPKEKLYFGRSTVYKRTCKELLIYWHICLCAQPCIVLIDDNSKQLHLKDR